MTARIAALAAALALGAGALAGCGRDEVAEEPARADRPDEVVLTPEAVDREAAKRANRSEGGKGRVVELRGAGERKTYGRGADYVSPGAATDAEVKADLREARAELAKFKRFLGTSALAYTGPRAKVLRDGTAVAPEDAPEVVKQVIQAGNAIATFPYKWGGGHGAWRDSGYDCSGSVSFALAAAGLLKSPLTSGGFLDWGRRGTGEWITIYTNPGHMFMVVAGLRFDTSGRGRAGTRWQEAKRSVAGLEPRHMPGL